MSCFEFKVKNKAKVTDVGFRLKIAQRIPDELDVRAENINKNEVRIIVKGKEHEAKAFYEKLKEELGNPQLYGFRKVTPTLVKTDRFFHKLECEQLGKFVDVGLEMRDAIKEMTKGFKLLPKNIAKAIKEK